MKRKTSHIAYGISGHGAACISLCLAICTTLYPAAVSCTKTEATQEPAREDLSDRIAFYVKAAPTRAVIEDTDALYSLHPDIYVTEENRIGGFDDLAVQYTDNGVWRSGVDWAAGNQAYSFYAYTYSGGSGTETVNESLSTNVDWYASQGSVTFVGKSTTPQPGAGTLTVSISWQTRAKSGPIYINNNQCYLWSTNSQIYIDIFKVSGDGTVSVESQRLVNETGIGYGQGIQTRTFTVDLGPEMCSWVVRKETQAASRATGSGYEDMVSFLRLNSYSYTTNAETLAPSGEVFYLAIGR